jgi:hypothetical protein
MRTIDETVEQLYAAVSFSKPDMPNLLLLKELFIPGAKLINNNDEHPQIYSIDGFIDSFRQNLETGVFESVFEVEIAHKTDIFGKIAQRFSTYEFRFNPNDEAPYSVGINAIQLIQIDNLWTITSMVWNDQKPGLEIPEIYLLM